MRFSLFTVLAVLALATGAVAASPQPTAQNGTDTPTATATPTASTTTAPTISATTTPTATPTSSSDSSSSAPAPTGTPRPTADDVLDDVDPRNATLNDVRTVAEWVRSEGGERGGRQADRARRWLSNATGRNISLPDISIGGPNATATPTATRMPDPTPVPAPESDGNVTRIDSETAIVASEYDPQKGIAKVTVRSESAQVITFSDGGFLADGGGEAGFRAEAFGAGEKSTVAIPVTEAGGRAAVILGTEETPIYGVIVKQSGGGLDVIRALSGLQGLIIGVVVAFVWAFIAGYNELRGERGRPEVA